MPPAADASAPPHGAALHEAKTALRRDLLSRRDALPIEHRVAAGDAILARIAVLPSFVHAHTVLLTLAFRSEWDTLPLVRTALAAGKIVVLPRVDQASRMLALHALSDPVADIVPGYRGIPEPRADAPAIAAERVDWVLVPGVAFDRDGRRLGYGGGFYDRLLPLLAGHSPRIAACYALQIVDAVPSGPHDARMDVIITEHELLSIAREG